MIKKFFVLLGVFVFVFQVNAVSFAEDLGHPQDSALNEVRIEQHLDQQLPLDAMVIDENGKKVPFGTYFKDKPVVLAFVYYECPMLCGLILNGLLKTLRTMKLSAGKDFEVVAVSVDHEETSDLAREKKKNYVLNYDRKGSEEGFHFLVGDKETVKNLANTAGFYYVYDKETDEYAHASAIMVATPEGKMARYFYGIEYPARDLKLSLVEASDNKIGSLVDQILLFCYHYDPTTGKYGFAVMNALRVVGVLTVLAMAILIITFLRRERRTA